MHSASGPASIGAQIRRRRLAAGLSLGGLADRVHYSKGYLSKIENGSKRPGPDLVRLCDAALGAGGELRRLAESDAVPEVVEASGDSRPVSGPEMNRDGGPGPVLGRREVLAIGGSLPLLAAAGPDRLATVAADDSITTGFTAMLAELRKLGQNQPPGLLLPILDIQVQTLLALAKAARSDDRGALLMLTSRFAEYTGWMAQESGDDRAMVRWTDLAVSCANAAGDRELAAYAHIRHANAALYRDDAVSTVSLATRAEEEAPAGGPSSIRVRALAAQRRAQGLALQGRYDDCRRALDRADDLFERAVGVSTPLGPTTVANPSDLVLGWCLHDLGRSHEAVPVLERHLARVPQHARRARARVKGRLALAAAGAGDPDTACALAHQVLDDAVYVDSATVRHDLRHLGRALNRWRTRPEVQSVSPRLAQALRTSAS